MEQSFVMFKEMTYDRCVEYTFYTIIGFLDEQSNLFKGIEISEKECDITNLDKIKEHLKYCITNTSMRLFYGRIEETFDYYTYDLINGSVCSGSLKLHDSENNDYAGSRYKHENQTVYINDSFYNKIGSISHCVDEELKETIHMILAMAHQNYTWFGVQQALLAKPYTKKTLSNKTYQKTLQS